MTPEERKDIEAKLPSISLAGTVDQAFRQFVDRVYYEHSRGRYYYPAYVPFVGSEYGKRWRCLRSAGSVTAESASAWHRGEMGE